MVSRQQPRQQACCCSCCSPLVSIGITVLILWLNVNLRVFVSSPKCSLEEFDAFALNMTANVTQTNHTIHYDLKLKNMNNLKGIHYDALNVTFYYVLDGSFPIGNATYPAFYQGYSKSTHRVANIEPTGTFWESATAAVRSNGSAVFRVELVTAVRYKDFLFTTKRRHRVKVATDFKVNDEGKLVKRKKKKGVKLTSASAKIRCSCINLLGFSMILVFLHLW